MIAALHVWNADGHVKAILSDVFYMNVDGVLTKGLLIHIYHNARASSYQTFKCQLQSLFPPNSIKLLGYSLSPWNLFTMNNNP